MRRRLLGGGGHFRRRVVPLRGGFGAGAGTGGGLGRADFLCQLQSVGWAMQTNE